MSCGIRITVEVEKSYQNMSKFEVSFKSSKIKSNRLSFQFCPSVLIQKDISASFKIHEDAASALGALKNYLELSKDDAPISLFDSIEFQIYTNPDTALA